MTEQISPARKKVVVLAAAICCFAAFTSTLPGIAARHNIPSVWVAIPMIAVLTLAVVYLVIAFFDLKKAR